jgi:hypothetical protein
MLCWNVMMNCVAKVRHNTSPRKTCYWCIHLWIHQPPIKWRVVVVLAWSVRVINRHFNDNWKTKEVVPIMSVFVLVLNLYARSATESQVIILDLILSLISLHRGLLVHNLFQNYTILFYLVQHSTVCNNVFWTSHRLRGRHAVPSCTYEVCGAVAALVFF